MGGDITAVSAPGAGPTFTCFVKLTLVADAVPAPGPRLVTLAARGDPWRPRLVLIDLHMPGPDGYAATRRSSRLWPAAPPP